MDRRTFLYFLGGGVVGALWAPWRACSQPQELVGEPRPADAIRIGYGTAFPNIVSAINAGAEGTKFVVASGRYPDLQSIRPRARVEVWAEDQADLLAIPNKWGFQPGEFVDTPAHLVRPSTELVFAPGVEQGVECVGLGGQKLVDLALGGGTATGGPGAWGSSGRTVSRLFDGEIRRCNISGGEINGVGAMRGLVVDSEIHNCGERSGGFAAGCIKTVQSLDVVRCFVHDSLRTVLDPRTGGNGVWADRNTPILNVASSLIADCAGSGVFYEVSRDGFRVTDCLVWNNNKVNSDTYAGVKMVSSMSGEVARCDIRGNMQKQIFAWNDSRWNDHITHDGGRTWGWPINPLVVRDCNLGGASVHKAAAAGAPSPVVQTSGNS